MTKNRILSLAALMLSCTLTAWAADPTGEWKGEGPRGEITIVISRNADGSLEGKMITEHGRSKRTKVSCE